MFSILTDSSLFVQLPQVDVKSLTLEEYRKTCECKETCETKIEKNHFVQHAIAPDSKLQWNFGISMVNNNDSKSNILNFTCRDSIQFGQNSCKLELPAYISRKFTSKNTCYLHLFLVCVNTNQVAMENSKVFERSVAIQSSSKL